MTRRRAVAALLALAAILAGLAGGGSASAAEYTGRLIDAHSHVPNGTAINAYVDAMKRHNVSKVVLLGVGGVQKDDPAWIAAAARKYPDRVVVGAPVADPMAADAADKLEAVLAKGQARAVGEVHVRQASRKIDRNPADPAFGRVLAVAARHRTPVVIHAELNDAAAAGLEQALAAHRDAVILLAHGGETAPSRLDPLLGRHPNLVIDLSGMHFMRTPALATETGPLDPAWAALIDKHPDRFVIGVDVWAARLFEPAMLDRLFKWTRRILGALRPEVAEKVAFANAVRLFRLD
jgi:predicted TIM-barrel fold metal-dependent hydrolase